MYVYNIHAQQVCNIVHANVNLGYVGLCTHGMCDMNMGLCVYGV